MHNQIGTMYDETTQSPVQKRVFENSRKPHSDANLYNIYFLLSNAYGGIQQDRQQMEILGKCAKQSSGESADS